jgi:hypothetical protein
MGTPLVEVRERVAVSPLRQYDLDALLDFVRLRVIREIAFRGILPISRERETLRDSARRITLSDRRKSFGVIHEISLN